VSRPFATADGSVLYFEVRRQAPPLSQAPTLFRRAWRWYSGSSPWRDTALDIDIEQIRELVAIVRDARITELTVRDETGRITIRKNMPAPQPAPVASGTAAETEHGAVPSDAGSVETTVSD